LRSQNLISQTWAAAMTAQYAIAFL
jgi:hypothetical protein